MCDTTPADLPAEEHGDTCQYPRTLHAAAAVTTNSPKGLDTYTYNSLRHPAAALSSDARARASSYTHPCTPATCAQLLVHPCQQRQGRRCLASQAQRIPQCHPRRSSLPGADNRLPACPCERSAGHSTHSLGKHAVAVRATGRGVSWRRLKLAHNARGTGNSLELGDLVLLRPA